jgi:hypothetical protein
MLAVFWDSQGALLAHLRNMVKMWILHRTVKYCWIFWIKLAEIVKANWQKGYCFIMTVPDNIQPEQPKRELKKLQWELLEHPSYSPDLALSDFHLFSLLTTTLVANISLMTKRLKRRCGSCWGNSLRLLFCGFRRHTNKAMGEVYQCCWMIDWEINDFSSSNIRCFWFYIHLWSFFTVSFSYYAIRVF